MKERIRIGKKGTQTGIWVSPAGESAGGAGVSKLLDTDYDFLRIRWVLDQVVNLLFDPESGYYYMDKHPIFFPTQLTYWPKVLVSCTDSPKTRAYFPDTNSYADEGFGPPGTVFFQVVYELRKDRILLTTGNTFEDKIPIRLTIFDNEDPVESTKGHISAG